MPSLRKRKPLVPQTEQKAKQKRQEDATRSKPGEGSLPSRCLAYLFEPDDASYLAGFRIMWGLVMMLEMYEHCNRGFGKMMSSWYSNPAFMFKYWAMEWTRPLPETQMKVFLLIMLVLAFFITIGLFYRTSCAIYTLGFIYLYSLEAGIYLNHFYLVIVMAIMLAFLPCNVYFSVDAWLDPKLYSPTVPKWVLITIKAELWIVYTYAGVAKMNVDWFRAEPLRHWLPKRFHYPIIGSFLQYEPAFYFFSYSGLFYDLFIGTALVIPQTFYIGLMSTLFFHLTNKYIFNIGIFPWLMIATTTLFFRPSWPRHLLHEIRHLGKKKVPPFVTPKAATLSTVRVRSLTTREWLSLALVVIFLSQQLAFPLRHHTYPGDPFWNEHGHRYSWRMKLRDKQCESTPFAYMPTSKEWFEYPVEQSLTPRQYQKLSSRPEFMVQFAHFAADRMQMMQPEHERMEMYYYTACRVNYREVKMLTDPRANVVAKETWDWPYDWVTEIPSLTDEDRAGLPWNWDWNFNWLLKPWKSAIPDLVRQQESQMHAMRDLEETFRPDFEAWILEEKFGGDEKLMKQKERVYVDEEKRKQSKERALAGLLLPKYMTEYAKKLEAAEAAAQANSA